MSEHGLGQADPMLLELAHAAKSDSRLSHSVPVLCPKLGPVAFCVCGKDRLGVMREHDLLQGLRAASFTVSCCHMSGAMHGLLQ